MPLHADTPSPAIQALLDLEAPRVWSVLVSIFGDLAHLPGDRIEGPLLTRFTDAMDIKPEAVRVALHRLRNDGWITSEKSGRTAQHGLTEDALRARNEAAASIYARSRDMPQGWQLAAIPQADTALRTALTDRGFVQITPRMFVAHDGVLAPDGVLLTTGKTAPSWVARDLLSDDLARQLDTLLTALQRVRVSLDGPRSLSDTALLRCLIVHHWRRLVLRHPFLPPALTGPNWVGHQCRDLVCDLLDALPRPSLQALAAEVRNSS